MRTWDEIIRALQSVVVDPKLSRLDVLVDVAEQAGNLSRLTRKGREGKPEDIERAAAGVLSSLAALERVSGCRYFEGWYLTDNDIILNAPREILLLRLHSITRSDYMGRTPAIIATILFQCDANYKRALELALFGEEKPKQKSKKESEFVEERKGIFKKVKNILKKS